MTLSRLKPEHLAATTEPTSPWCPPPTARHTGRVLANPFPIVWGQRVRQHHAQRVSACRLLVQTLTFDRLWENSALLRQATWWSTLAVCRVRCRVYRMPQNSKPPRIINKSYQIVGSQPGGKLPKLGNGLFFFYLIRIEKLARQPNPKITL